MSRIILEVCVDDAAGIAAAAEGGADRIELCAALGLGGLTPSAGLIEIARRVSLPAMAMIRPRAGEFVWSRDEVDAQLVEIAAIRAAGLAGVVIGASRPDGSLDGAVLRELVQAAKGLDITLHRAIDLTTDIDAAMRICADLGIRRVLSSGGARTALDGMARLQQMGAHGVTVMPGGGVNAANAAQFARALNLTEIHASCSVTAPTPQNPAVTAFGFQPEHARATDAGQVAALRHALDHLGARTSG